MVYEVGDKVVYPSQGVSVVEEIGEETLGGQKTRCYHLRLLSSNSKVMVPVDNCERVGLRPLSPPQEVERVMRRLRGRDADDEEDWKDRYRANLDRIKTGDLEEIVDVLLCLIQVSSRKTLSFRERKMFDHARQLLVWEISQVEERDVAEVESEIEQVIDKRLEKSDE